MKHKHAFRNPIEWAEKTVGTKARYCLSIIATIFVGCLLVCHYILALFIRPMSFINAVCYASVVVAGAVLWPLCCIKSLRTLVLDRNASSAEAPAGDAPGPEAEPPSETETT